MLASNRDEVFMLRCFDLARMGRGRVSPNPMVGAVLVWEDRIIGEGFHERYGFAHAEVNALRRVAPADRHLIGQSTLYVSLEPCCFFGKTPPCTEMIIREKIPRVVISCLDDTPEVSGKGVAYLQAAGVEVKTGVLEAEGRRLSRPRSIFVLEHRPYVVLKFAQNQQGLMGAPNEQIWITNPYTLRLVHRWRSESDAILVGSGTVLTDDPQLTNRLYFGASPQRVVLDRRRQLRAEHRVFDGEVPTLVMGHDLGLDPVEHLEYLPLSGPQASISELLAELARRRIGTLLVEGGRQVLLSFLESGLWDEARVLTGPRAIPGEGIPAPRLAELPAAVYPLGSDELAVYFRGQALAT